MQPVPLQKWMDRIVIDEEILTGKPVIKGTRLAVEFTIDLLAHGWSEAEILENYPGIVVEDIIFRIQNSLFCSCAITKLTNRKARVVIEYVFNLISVR
jgi:uncharacterized protein (DUF433 family)